MNLSLVSVTDSNERALFEELRPLFLKDTQPEWVEMACDVLECHALDPPNLVVMAKTASGHIAGGMSCTTEWDETSATVQALFAVPVGLTGHRPGTGGALMGRAAQFAATLDLPLRLQALQASCGFYERLGMRRMEGNTYGWTADECAKLAQRLDAANVQGRAGPEDASLARTLAHKSPLPHR